MSTSDLQENPSETAEVTPVVSDWPSPGQKLKKYREEKGLSHNRVADALHLTAHYIKALESDQYDKLPGKTFVKGYFRAYAKLLGADVEEVMTCYERYVSALEESEETEANVIRARKAYDQNLRWMICAAVIIVLVIGASWWFSSQKSATGTMAGSPSVNVVQVERSEAPVAGRSAASTSVSSSDDGDAMTAEALIATLGDDSGAEAGENDAEAGLTGDVAAADEIVMPSAPDTSVAASTDETLQDGNPDVSRETDARVADETGSDVTGPAETTATVADTSAVEQTAAEAGLTPAGLPDYTVIELADRRQVQLESEGNDLLQVHFSGASWIEVDNGENTRLYNDMLSNGDDLTIRGMAPFNVLIGDANMVDMTFNSRAVDLSSSMRTDNSARIILEPETN